MINRVRNNIEKLERQGLTNIRVLQAKRYISADLISANGYWYKVTTNPDFGFDLLVTGDEPKQESWMDDNGRAL